MSNSVLLASLAERLDLADQLVAGRDRMLEPQDLPGRYGRVVKAVDHVLESIDCQAVVGGGWAVWRHGYVGRVTQDLDIVLPANKVEEFLRACAVSGFEQLSVPEGRWPKVWHQETGIQVDILPEGGRPGTANHPAPTTIPHPAQVGGSGPALRYLQLAPLVELKLAAARAQDEADVIKLIQANGDQLDEVRQHLEEVYRDYVDIFDRLVLRAQEEAEE